MNSISAPRRHTQLVVGSQARAVLMRSLAQSIRSIGPSLGPQGRGVLHEISPTATGSTRGGFEIAKRITAEHGAASIAPRLIKEAMWEIQRDLGDGTTRFACIAQAVFAQACVSVAQGIHPTPLRRAIDRVAARLPDQLAALRCTEAPSAKAIALSACGDAEVAQLVAGLAPKLLDEGAFEVKAALQPGIELVRHDGFSFDANPELVGLSAREQALRLELDEVHVLVINEVLDDFGPLVPILEGFVARGKSLLIAARDFGSLARATLQLNRSQLAMHLVGLTPADRGPRAAQILEDLAVARATPA